MTQRLNSGGLKINIVLPLCRSCDPLWPLDMWPDLREKVLHMRHFNTQISPPYYVYVDTLSYNPYVHVLFPTVHKSAFLRPLSEAYQTSMNACFIFICLWWLLSKGYWGFKLEKIILSSIDVLPSKNQALCVYCTLVSKLKHYWYFN